MIEVVDPGLLALVEDEGRIGLGHLGVPRSGAADLDSYRFGNRLVGNPPGAAAIEVTYGAAAFVVRQDCGVAVTGAPVPLLVDGRPAATHQAVHVRRGSVLELGRPTVGVRAYVCVAGGIDVPAVLGSRSADTLAGLGPAPLRAGDLLPVGTAVARPPCSPGVVMTTTTGSGPLTVELTPGPRDHLLGAPAMGHLVGATWAVSPASNRVGVRLQGPAVPVPDHEPLASEGLVLGAIQIPPSGQPIVFLADHPATGGYPVIGVLTDRSIARLAQLPPGALVRFARRP